MDNKKCVVVLINGTFNRAAPWMRSDSPMVQALRRNPLFRVRRHSWTGANSGAARRLAAASLIKKLHAWQAKDPTSEVAVICHSHGGNVALHALQDGRCSIQHGVFLGTPFLSVRRRNTGTPHADVNQAFQKLVYLMVMTCLAPAALFLYLAGSIWLVDLTLRSLPAIKGVAGTILGMTTGLCVLALNGWVLFRALFSWLPAVATVSSRRIDQWLESPRQQSLLVDLTKRPRNTLVVVTDGDEAWNVLAAQAFASWAATRCLSYLYFPRRIAVWARDQIDALVGKSVLRATIAAACIFLGLLALILNGAIVPWSNMLSIDRDNPWVDVMMGIVMSILLPLILYLVTLSLVCLTLAIVACCVSPILGPGTVALSLLHEVHIAVAPLGFVEVLSHFPSSRAGSRHGALHSDREVAETVANWLSQKVAT